MLALDDEQLSKFRGQTVSMIFQEPGLALDPVYTIGDQIAESVMRHEGKSRSEALARALQMLDVVRIPSAKRRLNSYPHEMSGGMRQRAMIALALACKPKVLLADEPTTALDATVQIQILLLLRELQREFGMSVIFVTHDIGVAIEICDRISVMYMRDRWWRPAPIARSCARRCTLSARPADCDRAWRHARRTPRDYSGTPPSLDLAPGNCSFCTALPFRRAALPGATAPPVEEWPRTHCALRAGQPHGPHVVSSSLRPMTPPTTSARQTSRPTPSDSWNTTRPRTTVPTAPIPVADRIGGADRQHLHGLPERRNQRRQQQQRDRAPARFGEAFIEFHGAGPSHIEQAGEEQQAPGEIRRHCLMSISVTRRYGIRSA